jgi:hypothetical protein
MRLVTSSALVLALSATAAPAATFNIFEAGTTTLLGTFEAPLGGGALTTASISVDGGLFNVLDGGTSAPVYDAVNNWITGAGDPFAGITNSVAYNTTDIAMNPITCGVGECVFALTDSSGPGVPPEWAIIYLPGPASIDFGFYEIQPVPLPATALMLAGALAAFGAVRRCSA